MRALIWLVGVLVILLGLDGERQGSSIWTAVWVSTAVLWLLIGAGLALVAIARLATGRFGAGGNLRASRPSPSTPPRPKEE